MADPQTSLHYTTGANIVNGQYVPGSDGFNLADVSSVDGLNSLPAGVKGLVYLNMVNGADATFQATVKQFSGNPKLYGFYVVDEPDPTGKWGTYASAANLKAESDWIHANVPGAKTFIVLMNMGSEESPSYANTYNPANTDIDLFGIDPYPVRSDLPGGFDPSIIGKAVNAAEAAGIPASKLVPVYQAFGNWSPWVTPTASQEQQILSTWGQYLPTPAFDYAYSWGVQNGDVALSGLPDLQKVFATHNGLTSSPTPTPTPTTLTAQIKLTSATEGKALDSGTQVASFTDSNTADAASGFAATITWGDGATSTGTVSGSKGAFTVSAGHTYADEGSFPLSVAITRTADNAKASASGSVAVADADVLSPHAVSITGTAGQPINGATVATFSDSYTGSTAADFTASINWGDAATSSGIVSGANGTFSVSGSHTYATSGTRTVGVTLAEDSPGTAKATANSSAAIGAGSTGGNGGKTISTAVKGPVHMATADSPLTVTSTGSVTTTASNSDGIDGASTAPSTITNFGKISATGGAYSAGVWLPHGGSVTNAAGASVSGVYGVEISAGSGTITNSGTITGTNDAVLFDNSGTNRLVVNPSAVFNGRVEGGSGASTLELAGGKGTISKLSGGSGTVSQNGNWSFDGFKTISIGSGGNWTLNGGNVANLANNGTVNVTGSVDVSSAVDPASTGVFLLNSGATLEVAAATGSKTQIAFIGSSKLVIDNAASFGSNAGTASYGGPLLESFGTGDAIDIKQFGAAGAALQYTPSTGLLQISNSAGQKATLAFQSSSLGSGAFHVASDGGSGMLISHS